jgi:hypothetical protein
MTTVAPTKDAEKTSVSVTCARASVGLAGNPPAEAVPAGEPSASDSVGSADCGSAGSWRTSWNAEVVSHNSQATLETAPTSITTPRRRPPEGLPDLQRKRSADGEFTKRSSGVKHFSGGIEENLGNFFATWSRPYRQFELLFEAFGQKSRRFSGVLRISDAHPVPFPDVELPIRMTARRGDTTELGEHGGEAYEERARTLGQENSFRGGLCSCPNIPARFFTARVGRDRWDRGCRVAASKIDKGTTVKSHTSSAGRVSGPGPFSA